MYEATQILFLGLNLMFLTTVWRYPRGHRKP